MDTDVAYGPIEARHKKIVWGRRSRGKTWELLQDRAPIDRNITMEQLLRCAAHVVSGKTLVALEG